MKHVRALASEPPLLAHYRATYPHEEVRPASEAKATWEGFKTDLPAYREVLARLKEKQQGLCIYCEQGLSDGSGQLVANDYQVEHVLAKSKAAGRVLDWHNLALACCGGTYPHHLDSSRAYCKADNTSCGQAKGDTELPDGCDPRTFPLLDAVVEVGNDGKLQVNLAHCRAAGITPENVASAVARLGLDCERLRKARQDSRDNVNEWLVPLLAELLSATNLQPTQRQQMLGLFIAGRLQPDASGCLRAWWSTERCALGPDAETWISHHQGLFQ
jgi:uncharacterized protein (TIGR02646 family)